MESLYRHEHRWLDGKSTFKPVIDSRMMFLSFSLSRFEEKEWLLPRRGIAFRAKGERQLVELSVQDWTQYTANGKKA